MGTVKATGGRPDVGVLDVRRAGPGVPRMLLGTRLSQLRESRGLSREAVCRRTRITEPDLHALERGRTVLRTAVVAGLLDLYGVADDAERATLMELADQAAAPGWWESYGDVVPPWMQAYIGLEQAAAVIRTFEVRFVPSLLRTAEYARAAALLDHPGAPVPATDRRVELLTRRARVLRRERPPYLWALIDEAALRRVVGGRDVMRAQLCHLMDMCLLPHVTVQVLPFEAGGGAGAGQPVTVLRLPEARLPDVVCREVPASAAVPDHPEDLPGYWHTLNRLAVAAEPATATRTLLRWISDET